MTYNRDINTRQTKTNRYVQIYDALIRQEENTIELTSNELYEIKEGGNEAIINTLPSEVLLIIDETFQELSLSRVQRYILANWNTGVNLNSILANAGVSKKTLENWKYYDPDFKIAVRLLEFQQRQACRKVFLDAAYDAAQKICELARKGNLNACKEVLNNAGIIAMVAPNATDVSNAGNSNADINTINQALQINVNLSAHTEADKEVKSDDKNEVINADFTSLPAPNQPTKRLKKMITEGGILVESYD